MATVSFWALCDVQPIARFAAEPDCPSCSLQPIGEEKRGSANGTPVLMHFCASTRPELRENVQFWLSSAAFLSSFKLIERGIWKSEEVIYTELNLGWSRVYPVSQDSILTVISTLT